MKCTMRVLASSILIALSPLAAAQATGGGDIDVQVRVLDATAANKGQALVAGKIASNFTYLAGGEENATALVNALRTGGDATLTTTVTTPGAIGAPPTTTTTSTVITTPTGQMGWGNVKIALGLAQDQLLRAGITDPTPEQLQTALNGGTLTRPDGTTLEVNGVLQMRADGMGWGQIAKAGGTKVGPVVSTLRQTNAALEKLPPPDTTTTAAAPAPAKTWLTKGKAASVTTAAGATAGGPAKGQGKGITTAAGGTTGGLAKGQGKGITTAAGGTTGGLAKGQGKGITTAAGGSTHGPAKGPKGIMTAAGTGGSMAGASSKGITTAGGVSAAGHGQRGLVTAAGVGGGNPAGNAYGRGVVTAAGGGAPTLAAAGGGRGHGAGVVTASGSSGAGITRGGGGKGNGHGKLKPGGG